MGVVVRFQRYHMEWKETARVREYCSKLHWPEIDELGYLVMEGVVAAQNSITQI
jgi:hypothetical protein